MSEAAKVVGMEIERDWFDGLKAIDEQYEEAPRSLARCVRIGRGLLAGRSKCPADLDYKEWIATTGYGAIKDDERQDSAWLALNEEVAIPALAETRINNPSWARRHIRMNLPTIYALCRDVRSVTEASVTEASIEHPAESALIEPLAPGNSAIPESENSKPGIEHSPHPVPKSLLAKALFVRRGYPKAELVLGYVLRPNTRSVLARALPKQRPGLLWQLLIESIESGLFGPPNDFDIATVTLRVLLPWLPPVVARRLNLDLTRTEDQAIARDDVLPIVRANKALLIEQPDKLVTLDSTIAPSARTRHAGRRRTRRWLSPSPSYQ
jgi:hypothetical protein